MYLWQPVAGAFYPPCVDGDYDAGVIGHEYGHMIENRMIGKGASRSGHHAGAMGESVGDLMAIEQLNEHGNIPTDGANRWATGTYATGNKPRGIRNHAGNWPSQGAFPTPSVYAEIDPLNFSDIGYDVTGPQVHADGEIWTATNFDVRKALAAKYDAQYPECDQALQEQCAKGLVAVDRCPGNRRWIQLVFDSFLLMPTTRRWSTRATRARGGHDAVRRRQPGRAVARVRAPRPRPRARRRRTAPAGARRRRVRHRSAAGLRGAGPGQRDADVRRHDARRGADAGQRADLRRPPRGARLADRRHRPGDERAGDGARANNLDATAAFAPGTYEFVATAPGYGAVRFRRTVRAGAGADGHAAAGAERGLEVAGRDRVG